MTEKAETPEDVRKRILSEPDLILEDHDLMQALVTAKEKGLGPNVVDIRGIAMQRLEARLGRLEDTHRSVIAAAYDNLAGMTQVHRAVLRILEPATFEEFLRCLDRDVAEMLRVARIRLVFESAQEDETPGLRKLGAVISVAEPGFVDEYLTHGRDVALRAVTLREVRPGEGGLYGSLADRIGSEACIKLDLGADRMPAMLALGAEESAHFAANQGTDLLEFFAGAFERALRRWLA